MISRIFEYLLEQDVVRLEPLQLSLSLPGMVQGRGHCPSGEVDVNPDRTPILVMSPTAELGVVREGEHVSTLPLRQVDLLVAL